MSELRLLGTWPVPLILRWRLEAERYALFAGVLVFFHQQR